MTDVNQDLEQDTTMTTRRQRRVELPPELTEFSATYEIDCLIGEGGMSSVYKVRHRALDKPMAIKMLHTHLERDVVQRRRFEQEAQALFMLEHPNIVKLRDFGSTKDSSKPYLIMDYLQGKSLADVLKESGPIPVNRALKLFMQICDALEHAHEKNIIHRDIKPSNIVLTEDTKGSEQVRIVDFGIAKFSQDDINPGLTQTGDVFGSPLYMSPEQCLGHKLDRRSDIYALGCVMYEALSGHPPLAGETALSTIHKHTSEMPQPLQVPDCDPKLRENLDAIIFKTLEKDPEKRYQSMKSLRNDLQELLEDTGYRKGAGYYIRFARFQRKVFSTIKKYPYRFLAGFVLLTVIVTYSAAYALQHTGSVFTAPEPLVRKLTWDWVNLPVEPKPVHFHDSLRKARFFLDQTKQTLGTKDLQVMKREQKLAKYLMTYGCWDEAIDALNEVREQYQINYGANDANIPDIDALIGDCYMQRKNYERAVEHYSAASQVYDTHFDNVTTDNMPALTRLKLGIALLRMNQYQHAMKEFVDQDRTKGEYPVSNNDFQSTMAKSGQGDCELISALYYTPDAAKKDKLLEEARLNYGRVRESWQAFSDHDASLCRVRLADIAISKGDWRSAKDIYNAVLHREGLFNDTELATLKRNYARVLLRTGDIAGALAADEQASHHAKSADARQSSENKTSFYVPDRGL